MSDFDRLAKSLASGVLDNADKDKCTLVINGKEIPAVSATIKRSIESCVDGFNATIAMSLDYKDPPVRAYGYEKCEVYLGSNLVITGVIYTSDIDYNINGYSANIEGSSIPTDLIDSEFFPPYDMNQITLPEIAQSIIDRLGIDIEVEVKPYDINNEFFERIDIDESDTMLNLLHDLALQRGILVLSTKEGNLLLTRTNDAGKPVCVIGDEKNPLSNVRAKFDGRKRFNKYRAYATSPLRVQVDTKKRRKKSYRTYTQYRSIVILDNEVPETRQTSCKADDNAITEEEKAAAYSQKRAYADSLEIKIPVNSWYIFGKEELWEENTLVTLQHPAIFLKNGFDMLIREVTYTFNSDGCTAVLDVVPPQCYSDKIIPTGIFSEDGASALDTALANIGIGDGIQGVPDEWVESHR